MRNFDTTPILPQTRAFIVLLALLQALVLYVVNEAQSHTWWWLSATCPQVYWYTLILAVPTAMSLSVFRLNDRRFWQHALAIAVVYALLASWAAWSVSGAYGIGVDAVLLPFGIVVGAALFVTLPFLQCRQAHVAWRAGYPKLFDHAWQNGLTLVVALLFTGLCWLVLLLWAGLFKLVHLRFFYELFFRHASFAYLASGLFAGLGVLIGRTQTHPLRVARQIVFAVCRGLLPLLALIALLFLASLPFTGLAPLWATRSAATLLMGLLLVLVIFTNAVWQDGVEVKPYPTVLRWLIDIALMLAPAFAVLALIAIGLRIDQYGWTAARFWSALLAVVLTCYAFGYAVVAIWRSGVWLQRLPQINVAVAGVVILLAMLANSPVLDPFRITVASQVGRLHAGRTASSELDVRNLRFRNGRRGYQAAVALQADPAVQRDPAAAANLQRVVKRQVEDSSTIPRDSKQAYVADLASLRAQIAIAPGAQAPSDDWYLALLNGQVAAGGCTVRGADCVLLTPALHGNGMRQNLLCNVGDSYVVNCLLSQRNQTDRWQLVAQASLSTYNRDQRVQTALRAGQLRVMVPTWPDIEVAGSKASFNTTCCQRPASAASATDTARP